MSAADESTFRKELIERVAYCTNWGRRWVTRGRDPELAKKLGLEPELLDEAAALLRSGFLPKQPANLGTTLMDLLMPRVLWPELEDMATSLDMTPMQLARSVFHTMMQTDREPTERSPRRWTKPGVGGKTKAGVGWRGSRPIVSGPGRKHYEVSLSNGLLEALGRRAASYGATRTRYCMLWLADLLDGYLADVVFAPVSTQQMFDDASAYVLPNVTTVEPT